MRFISIVLLAFFLLLFSLDSVQAEPSSPEGTEISLKNLLDQLKSGALPLRPYKSMIKPTELDKQILAAMSEYKVVGLSAAVVRGDKIIWSKGYGWANLADARESNPDTIYRVASLSKMLTATALMQLYEQGKFNLDDDVAKY